MNTLIQIILLIALLGSSLMAGLFFVFSNTVMKALSKLQDDEGIRAMRSINRVILNPIFLGAFMGTAVLSLAIALLALFGQGPIASHWFLSAAVVYLFGTFFCTIAGNVPLNEKLDKIREEEAPEFWQLYLRKWTRYNHYRSIASVLSVVLYAIGFMQL